MNIIKDIDGSKYIQVKDIPEYAREFFNTKFNIPSARTIRWWSMKGIICKPKRFNKETFYEVDYIMQIIMQRMIDCDERV